MLEIVPKLDADADSLRGLVRQALRSQYRAMSRNAVAIRRMAAAGAALGRAKGELEHGQFRSWLVAEQIVGDDVGQVSFETCRRWMKLATFEALHPGELEKASTVKAAFQLAGLIPEPDPSQSTGGSSGDSDLLTIIKTSSKLQEVLQAQIQERPITTWSREERAILTRRLQFYVDLYEQLTGEGNASDQFHDGGAPQGKESFSEGAARAV